MKDHFFKAVAVMTLMAALLSNFGCGGGPQNTNNAAGQNQNQNNSTASNSAAYVVDDSACNVADVTIKRNNVQRTLGKAFEADATISPHLKDGSLKFVITKGQGSAVTAGVRFFFLGDLDDAVLNAMAGIMKPLRKKGCIESVMHNKPGAKPQIPNSDVQPDPVDLSVWMDCQDPNFPCPEGCLPLPCKRT
jgi:hypothetical protein